jgi:signal transduction histidine kinase
MTTWLRGRKSAYLAFVFITCLVLGGLTWMTQATLRLEMDRAKAGQQAEMGTKLRLALWRLDSRLFTDLTTEASRPYSAYRLREPIIAVSARAKNSTGLFLLELVPLQGHDSSVMKRRFLVGPERSWNSPASFELRATSLGSVAMAKGLPPISMSSTPDPLIAELADHEAVQSLLTRVHHERLGFTPHRSEAVTETLRNGPTSIGGNSPPSSIEPKGKLDRDAALRLNQAQAARQQPYANDVLPQGAGEKGHREVVAIIGPFVPGWLRGPESRRLVLSRRLELDNRVAYDVAILDWPHLESMLAEEVRDLLPEVAFRPVPDAPSPSSERALTSLPVELELKAAANSTVTGWTPLRGGLALAWAAAIVALAAVGLGAWSLVEIAERRMRFVSAVTHELRTPLTTLRLYLDMLAGGLVRNEVQRAEYLHTLNAEAERLNRLVGNVLDFSRLENQRARVQRAPVAVGELLEEVRAAWQGPCRQAQKKLIVENELDPDAAVVTDRRLVNQILSNLIDNACKYSREADDRRIWLRAKNSGCRLVFEVEDRGKGVPPSEYRSVFRPFRRGRRDDGTTGGVGLGLALARRWAQDIGGRLSLASAASTGACFRLEVPLLESASNGPRSENAN